MHMESTHVWPTTTALIFPSVLKTDAPAALSWLETEKNAKLVSITTLYLMHVLRLIRRTDTFRRVLVYDVVINKYNRSTMIQQESHISSQWVKLGSSIVRSDIDIWCRWSLQSRVRSENKRGFDKPVRLPHKFSFVGDIREIKQRITMRLERKWKFRRGGDCSGCLSLKAPELALLTWRGFWRSTPGEGVRVMCIQGVFLSWIAVGCRMKPNTKSCMLKNCSSWIKTTRPEKFVENEKLSVKCVWVVPNVQFCMLKSWKRTMLRL